MSSPPADDIPNPRAVTLRCPAMSSLCLKTPDLPGQHGTSRRANGDTCSAQQRAPPSSFTDRIGSRRSDQLPTAAAYASVATIGNHPFRGGFQRYDAGQAPPAAGRRRTFLVRGRCAAAVRLALGTLRDGNDRTASANSSRYRRLPVCEPDFRKLRAANADPVATCRKPTPGCCVVAQCGRRCTDAADNATAALSRMGSDSRRYDASRGDDGSFCSALTLPDRPEHCRHSAFWGNHNSRNLSFRYVVACWTLSTSELSPFTATVGWHRHVSHWLSIDATPLFITKNHPYLKLFA